MAATDAAAVWLLIALLGLGVYALRVSFIAVAGVTSGLPPGLTRALSFIPAAVLAALITPAVLPLDAIVLHPRVLAAGIGLVTAWRTGSMIATIGVGMGVLWTLTVLVG